MAPFGEHDVTNANRSGAASDLVQATFERLLATGELLDQATFLESKPGWTVRSLARALRQHRLFRLEVGGVRAYPAFYADRRYDIHTLETVCKLLGDIPDGSRWLFFTQPKGSLAIPANQGQRGVPRTPLQAIEAGEFDLVMRSAIGFSQR